MGRLKSLLLAALTAMAIQLANSYGYDFYQPHNYRTRRFFLDNEICYGFNDYRDGRCLANIQSCPANRNPQDLIDARKVLCGLAVSPDGQPAVAARQETESVTPGSAPPPGPGGPGPGGPGFGGPFDVPPGAYGPYGPSYYGPYRPYFADVPPFNPHVYTFLASLHDASGRFVCSGALISADTVLTSAQCAPVVRQARFGEHHLNFTAPFERVSQEEVAGFEVHPQFNAATNDYDIAVVRLVRPVDVHYYHPAKFPRFKIDEPYLEGTKATQIGFGMLPDRPYLRAVKTAIIPEEECRRIFGWERDQLRRWHVCAGTHGGVCVSDLGAPLVKTTYGKWTVVGILTFGRHCHSKGLPVIFTRVDQVGDWIASRVSPPRNGGPAAGAPPANGGGGAPPAESPPAAAPSEVANESVPANQQPAGDQSASNDQAPANDQPQAEAPAEEAPSNDGGQS